jgi:hypothetical protein
LCFYGCKPEHDTRRPKKRHIAKRQRPVGVGEQGFGGNHACEVGGELGNDGAAAEGASFGRDPGIALCVEGPFT